jgi:hypothetical protein
MNTLHAGRVYLFLLIAVTAAGCQREAAPPPEPESSTTAPQPQPAGTGERTVNDFPTLARVEYVLQCMLEHGGQNYDNLYHCTCAADVLASKMSYEDYSQSLTFTYMFSTPGERGGEFRDPPESKRLRELLKESKALAQSRCFPDVPGGGGEKPAKK